MAEHSGRRIFITGGSSGIGRAAAELFGAEGARVAVSAIDADECLAVCAGITAAGGEAVSVPADTSAATSITAAVQHAAEQFGGLDTLVTSAGIQRYGTVVETEESVWDEVYAVNVKGVYLAARAAIPHLRRSAAGSIVIVSSIQAYMTQAGVAAYTSSKGALNALCRAMAVDEAAYHVRVNAVSPGSVDTPMLRGSAKLFSDGSAAGIDETIAAWGASYPLGRVAKPSEIAEVIAFLAGPRSSFVTGESIRVDGGILAALAVRLEDVSATAA